MRFLNFLFPTFCVVCKKRGGYICNACAPKIPFVTKSFCTICGTPFPKQSGVSNNQNTAQGLTTHPCNACLAKPPHYDTHRALVAYSEAVPHLVQQFKYDAAFWVLHFYENFLRTEFNFYGELFSDSDVILPIPLHPQRLCERGYNQSTELARVWQKKLQKPLVQNALVRTENTPPRQGLNRQERWDSLRQVFAVPLPATVYGRKILLVDDVHTTGATLSRASQTLKRAGAASIVATSLAVVPFPH